MTNRFLVVIQTPACFQHSASTFVINQFLFTGLTNTVSLKLHSRQVSYEDSLALADAIDQIPRTPQVEVGWALCGDRGGGIDALVGFLEGGSFEIVNGEEVGPEDLSDAGLS